MSSFVPTSFNAELYKNMTVSQLSMSSFSICDVLMLPPPYYIPILPYFPRKRGKIPYFLENLNGY